ncbi:unnamed protein product, partial [Larinioides sclopetarius]
EIVFFVFNCPSKLQCHNASNSYPFQRKESARALTSTSDSENIRLNGKLRNIPTGVRKDCKVCSQRNNPGKRNQTTYYCDTCPEKPGMHLGNCYMKCHTKQNY